MRRFAHLALLGLCGLAAGVVQAAGDHPRLFLQPGDLDTWNAPPGPPALFRDAVDEARQTVDPYLDALPDVPAPRDPGGGYTHEQHKKNGNVIQRAGMLYLLTGERAYADLVRDLLIAYGDLYPTLGEHPVKKSSTPGRLFWQSLNESVWLLTAIQGYDAVYTALTEGERQRIEDTLFRPLSGFLSKESPQVFNKIHNHGTWAVAAVGLTGYVLGDDVLVEQALYGLGRDGEGGFMRQIDELFSPDGYYSEGPYYHRYALMPFVLFARAIELNEPERKIFDHRDGVLLKAITTLVQLSYGGKFFPINDAITDKGLDTIEACHGVAIAWTLTGDRGLLSIAELQGRVVLTGDGLRLAAAMEDGLAEPFAYESMALRDGPDGDRGILGILRTGVDPRHMALVFKATGQGLGHGHFDRLGWLLYDNGREVVPDYGAARFLNVEAKHGGRYLPENETYAKQTVAHSTLVVDGKSQFDADWRVGEEHDVQPLAVATEGPVQLVSARLQGGWDGVAFSRRLAVVDHDALELPWVIDVLEIDSDKKHVYDLPLQYRGQVTRVSHPVKAHVGRLQPLGDDNGYQHMWVRAETEVTQGELFQVTWLEGGRFYTYSVLAEAPMQVFFAETGANDPEFNLRRESAVILRVRAGDHAFLGVLEPHGEYNGRQEYTRGGASAVAAVASWAFGDDRVLDITTTAQRRLRLGLSLDGDSDADHTVTTDAGTAEWTGPAHLWPPASE